MTKTFSSPYSNFVAVYITFPDEKTAVSISQILIKEKLGACANISKKIKSIYIWEDQLCEKEEVSVMIKTQNRLMDQLKKKIIQLHPYECPCIVAFPISDGNLDFFNWIEKQTS